MEGFFVKEDLTKLRYQRALQISASESFSASEPKEVYKSSVSEPKKFQRAL